MAISQEDYEKGMPWIIILTIFLSVTGLGVLFVGIMNILIWVAPPFIIGLVIYNIITEDNDGNPR